MAFHGTKPIPANTPTLITSEDVTHALVQNTGTVRVCIIPTEGEVHPLPDTAQGVWLAPLATIPADVALSEIFPGRAVTRLYAYASAQTTLVLSHA